MKVLNTLFKDEKSILITNIAWFFFITIILTSSAKYVNKYFFDFLFVIFSVLTFVMVIIGLYKSKLNHSNLWIFIASAGLLGAIYLHANKTIFVGDEVRPECFFTEKFSEFGVAVLNVAFITIVSKFLISAVETIRNAANTSEKVSNQNEKILLETKETLTSVGSASESVNNASRTIESYHKILNKMGEINEPIFKEAFTKALESYMANWVDIIKKFEDTTVTEEEKIIMIKLIEEYFKEETQDFTNFKVATNFGMYATLVSSIINLSVHKDNSNNL